MCGAKAVKILKNQRMNNSVKFFQSLRIVENDVRHALSVQNAAGINIVSEKLFNCGNRLRIFVLNNFGTQIRSENRAAEFFKNF